MMMFKLNMAQWPGRLMYFQHAGAIIVILSDVSLPLASYTDKTMMT